MTTSDSRERQNRALRRLREQRVDGLQAALLRHDTPPAEVLKAPGIRAGGMDAALQIFIQRLCTISLAYHTPGEAHGLLHSQFGNRGDCHSNH
jgi:DNA-binding LacI/PurR family transcriptional regulator